MKALVHLCLLLSFCACPSRETSQSVCLLRAVVKHNCNMSGVSPRKAMAFWGIWPSFGLLKSKLVQWWCSHQACQNLAYFWHDANANNFLELWKHKHCFAFVLCCGISFFQKGLLYQALVFSFVSVACGGWYQPKKRTGPLCRNEAGLNESVRLLWQC